MDMLLDHFILTFKHNALPVVVVEKTGKMVPAEWLMRATFEEADFVGFVGESVEISIPIGTFLQIKDNVAFQYRCRNLIRLRTTPRTLLSALCHPINHIDNKISPKD